MTEIPVLLDRRPGSPAPPGAEGPTDKLERAILLVRALGYLGRPSSLQELAAATDLPKSTVHRLLAQLCGHGWAQRWNGRYLLGADPVRLALAAAGLSSPRLRPYVLPHLLDLYEATRQSVNVGVLHGNDVRYIERIFGRSRVWTPSESSGLAPAHCTALGKVLLAFGLSGTGSDGGRGLVRHTRYTITDPQALHRHLTEVRDRGVAYSHGEFREELTCVAAPIPDADGHVRAAVALAGRAALLDTSEAQTNLRQAAWRISLELRLIRRNTGIGPQHSVLRSQP